MRLISLEEYKRSKTEPRPIEPGQPSPSTKRVYAKRDAQIDRLREIDDELRARLDALKEIAADGRDELHR